MGMISTDREWFRQLAQDRAKWCRVMDEAAVASRGAMVERSEPVGADAYMGEMTTELWARAAWRSVRTGILGTMAESVAMWPAVLRQVSEMVEMVKRRTR